MKKLFFLLFVFVVLIILFQKFNFFSNLPNTPKTPNQTIERQTVVYEESVITKVVEEILPSVVTVGISKVTSTNDTFEINPFNTFMPFNQIPPQPLILSNPLNLAIPQS